MHGRVIGMASRENSATTDSDKHGSSVLEAPTADTAAQVGLYRGLYSDYLHHDTLAFQFVQSFLVVLFGVIGATWALLSGSHTYSIWGARAVLVVGGVVHFYIDAMHNRCLEHRDQHVPCLVELNRALANKATMRNRPTLRPPVAEHGWKHDWFRSRPVSLMMFSVALLEWASAAVLHILAKG
jgi:hypothetical protein